MGRINGKGVSISISDTWNDVFMPIVAEETAASR
jgi:hypothetical protein